jgi:osmoprotectant transport system ATP-binding protein
MRRSSTPIPLEARDLTCRFGATLAVDGASVQVAAGRSVAIVGESGSGKTTLLRCFNRLVTPQSGSVTVGGVDVRDLTPEPLRRRIGYVPQQGGLLPHWRVLRNVALVPSLLGQPDTEKASRDALELVGLAPSRFGARFPHELSGGERQRVALARALAAGPGAILLDEPFGALDAITRAELQASFGALRRALSITTLLVTHDLGEAALLAEELVVMRAGRVEQQGTVRAVLAAPATPYVAALIGRAIDASAALRIPA